VLAATREAGAAILSLRRGHLHADRKADGSLVSAADHAASEIIGTRLRALDPGLPVVCEEASRDAAGAARFWLVDPLDGTREYLRGSDLFSVNVALVADGYPLFGAIHLPALELSYWGAAGLGARRNGDAIRARRLAEAGRRLRVLLSPGEAATWQPALDAALARLGLDTELEPVAGAIKFCWLAEGRADLYPRRTRTCAWDTAAGQAILEAAGGAVYDADWQRLHYRQSPGWHNGDFFAVADASVAWSGLFAGQEAG
jgi:3'(2'), 5'-bisphosphate nucleotidase